MTDLSEFEDGLRRVLGEMGEDWQQKIMILPQPPPLLWWARHLDDGDRAEFLSEVAVAAGATGTADLDALERCLEEWQKTAVVLADPAVREILTAEVIDPPDFTELQRPEPGYCRMCDVFIGYGGAGVAKPPDEHADDRAWLGSHCWVCGRSRDEIAAAR